MLVLSFLMVSLYDMNQVIAKLAVLVRNLEPKQGRIREEHDLWNEKWIIAHVRRTLISYGLYESGKSYALPLTWIHRIIVSLTLQAGAAAGK